MIFSPESAYADSAVGIKHTHTGHNIRMSLSLLLKDNLHQLVISKIVLWLVADVQKDV